MSEEKKDLTVYVMGPEDIHVGMTGRDEAPIAIVVPSAGIGIGLPVEVAHDLHDALCMALQAFDEQNEIPEGEAAGPGVPVELAKKYLN